MTFLTKRQGSIESNRSYVKRFTANVQNLITVRGVPNFLSPDLVKKLIYEATGDEFKDETEKFKAVCFLKRGDDTRYNELMEELRNGAYIVRDEYPVTVAAK